MIPFIATESQCCFVGANEYASKPFDNTVRDKENANVKGYWVLLILTGITVVFSVIGATTFMLLGLLTDMWHFGWIGFYCATLSLGAGNLYAATSTRVRAEQYNDLSDKLDNITSQQEALISLVQSPPPHATEEAPSLDSLTNSVNSIEAAIDRVRNSLNDDDRA